MITFGFWFCDSFILEVSVTFNSEVIAGKRSTQNANIQGKQRESEHQKAVVKT
jgi:hypothetical protein